MEITYVHDAELASRLPNLNYDGLRKMLPPVSVSALPHLKTLLARNPLTTFLAAVDGDISVTVYTNGAYLYKEGGAATVYSVSLASGLVNDNYISVESHGARMGDAPLGGDFLPLCPWHLPLIIAGQARLAENADKRQCKIRKKLDESKETPPQFSEAGAYSDNWLQTEAWEGVYERLESAVRELPHRERETVRLLFGKEMTRNQVAALLNVSPQRISAIKMRALARLEAKLAPAMAKIWRF